MSRPRVGLYGYFGRGNLGDEALRLTWAQALAGRFALFTCSPPRLPLRAGPWLFCGGLLQDRTSFRSLLFYLAAMEVAARRGPVGLASAGVDLGRGLSKRVAGTVLAKAGYLSVRDDLSRETLSRLGLRPKEYPDPVLSWPTPPRRPRKTVLINLVPKLPEGLRAKAIALARRWGGNLQAPVKGLAMAPADVPVLAGLPLLTPTHPREALEAIASARVLIGARLHALELALVAGTPFVALPYARKVEAFLRLVERELPAPLPRAPQLVQDILSEDWRRGLGRARERLREEAEEGIRDVESWLTQVA